MKNEIKYKGYTGLIEYDPQGRIFTGEVIGLKDVITFQGRNPDELEASLRESVELYLAMCAEDGVEPEKPYSGRFNVRLDPDLHRRAALCAAREHKSLNDWVSEAIERAVCQ